MSFSETDLDCNQEGTVFTKEESIQKLNDVEKILTKNQAIFEAKREEDIKTALKYASANQPLAFEALKRKQEHDVKLMLTDETLLGLQVCRECLTKACSSPDILSAINAASKKIAEAHEIINIDNVDVHNVMDERIRKIHEECEKDGRQPPLMSHTRIYDEALPDMLKDFVEYHAPRVSQPDAPSQDNTAI